MTAEQAIPMQDPSQAELGRIIVPQGPDLPRDNVVQGLAKPAPALLGEVQTVQERDPFSFAKEEFDTLHPAMQDRVSLTLMRQIPIRVLREGLKSGEERTPAQVHLETINPVLEIEYPISLPERLEFDKWKNYISRGYASVDPDTRDTWDDVGITTLLEQEIMRNKGKLVDQGERRQRKSVEGLKIGRYRRYQMQRQIEAELKAAEKSELRSAA